MGKTCEDSFHEVLRFRPRDENCRSNAKAKTVELLMPGDVLDGLVMGTPRDGFEIQGKLSRGELAGGVGEILRPGETESVEEEQVGVSRGGQTK